MAKTVVSKTNKTLEKMEEVVNKVISLIEEKNLLPWEQGFVPGVIVGGRLINHLTKRPYSGSNLMTLLWLSIASIGEDFAGEYMTAAAAKGASQRRAQRRSQFSFHASLMKKKSVIGKMVTRRRTRSSSG